MKFIINLFRIEKQPKRGLIAIEWAILAYTVFTLLIIFFTYTKAVNPDSMIWGRMRALATMAALWAVYRLLPCQLTMLVRVVVQMSMLAWWYPDTYELNRIFPNLDHIFAAAEQSLFGFQPALVFSVAWASPVVSELMSLGYAAYYPMIALVAFFYFFRRQTEFHRCTLVIMAAFFIYYVVYIFVPVVGPTFYYKAVGLQNIAQGIFPSLHDYFNTHTDCLATPGYTKGLFYALVEDAKAAGERPTAAFPSSHVGVSTIVMLLALHSRNRTLTLAMLPFYVLLCFSTVYIQAHYAIDSIAGLLSGVALYFLLMACTKRLKEVPHATKGRRARA